MRQRGGILVVLALAMCGMALCSALTVATVWRRGIGSVFERLGDDHQSGIECPGTPVTEMQGEAPTVTLDGGAPPVPCLPPRLDHATPGWPRGLLPPAICLLLRTPELRHLAREVGPCV